MAPVLLSRWGLNCMPTQKYLLNSVCFLLLVLLGGLQIPFLLAYPPARPPSVPNLGWPTKPISQVLFACCVNSYTAATVPRWPCLMPYSVWTVFSYSVYEVRVVAAPFLYYGCGKPSNALLPSCKRGLLLCCITDWLPDCPRVEKDD